LVCRSEDRHTKPQLSFRRFKETAGQSCSFSPEDEKHPLPSKSRPSVVPQEASPAPSTGIQMPSLNQNNKAAPATTEGN
jgi:hypothetical protein